MLIRLANFSGEEIQHQVDTAELPPAERENLERLVRQNQLLIHFREVAVAYVDRTIQRHLLLVSDRHSTYTTLINNRMACSEKLKFLLVLLEQR
jgi:hypothetical protein